MKINSARHQDIIFISVIVYPPTSQFVSFRASPLQRKYKSPVSQRFGHPHSQISSVFGHPLLILLQRFGHPPVPSRDAHIPSVLVIPSKKILDFAGKSKTF